MNFAFLKWVLYILLMIIAAFRDIRTYEIPNSIPMLIFLSGFIEFHGINAILGLLVSGLPYLIAAVISTRKDGGYPIGGGDIKLMAASGFALGFEAALIHNVISLLLISVFGFAMAKVKRMNLRELELPLAPFFCAGGAILFIFHLSTIL